MKELVKFTLPTHLEALVHGYSHAKVFSVFSLEFRPCSFIWQC